MAERNEKGSEKPGAAPIIARMFIVVPFMTVSLHSARIDRFRAYFLSRIAPIPRIGTGYLLAGLHPRHPRNPW
jgi:hypothetical protein